MIARRKNYWDGFIVGIMLWEVLVSGCWGGSQTASAASAGSVNIGENKSRPVIIWWARPIDGFDVNHTALSSGVFSHVLIANSHQAAELDNQTRPAILNIINFCKQKDITVIWMRWLYPGGGPGLKLGGFTLQDVYRADYYVTQINNLRTEAQALGVKEVAFDAEPYGACPLLPMVANSLSEVEFETMNNAIKSAVSVTGQVDYIVPSDGESKWHFWNCTRQLGKLTISEHTYFDIPSTHTKEEEEKRPHDYVGAFVDIEKKNPYFPGLPLFTPQEILQRQSLWTHKKGLMIYTANKERAILVANELSQVNFTPPLRFWWPVSSLK